MKITCQSCQAKYTIADEKVAGKVVKIRCKKCGSTIVVNGSDPSAAGHADDGGSSAEAAPAPDGWTVNVAEGDQRTMAQDEVVAAFAAGTIDDETYCWREGMPDWAPLREIDALRDACRAVARARPPAGAARPGGPGAARNGAADDARGSSRDRPDGDSPAGPAPNTARRAGGRAGSADIFASAAQAGGEDDVMTSVPAKLPQAAEHEDPQKLTGARNENSVLFSLQAVTGKPTKEAERAPVFSSPDSEASGLIDIRQLSAQRSSTQDANKKSRVDDIMNLSGGAFTPALTAPVLSAPHPESFASRHGAAGASLAPGRSRTPIFVALGIGALVIFAAVGGTMQMMRKASEPEARTDKPGPGGSAQAPEATAAGSPGASAAAASAAPGAAAVPAGNTAPRAQEPPPATAATTEAPSAPAAAAESKPKPASAPGHEAPAASRPSTPAAAESDQPFNMGEAKARLGAAADTVQSCKKGDTTGTGHVIITFAPSGSVQSAVVDGAPFEGTPTGACVAGRFRSVHVPAFGGSPFKVRKSFTIN